MIRSIVVCAALVLVLAATDRVGRSQSTGGEPAPTVLPDRDPAVVKSSPDGREALATYGSRRFGPLYEAGRTPPPTDDVGWPADWDQWPHLSVEVFGLTREFNATRDYRSRPGVYGDRGSNARRPFGPQDYGNGPYTPHGNGNGPYAPHGYGNGPYGRQGYGNGPYAPHGYGGGWENRDLFSSDSGFALRYGYPGSGAVNGQYPPSFGYVDPGSAYGLYPPWFGYGAHGGQMPYYGYGLPQWGNGLMFQPPGRYGPYFGW